MLEPKPSEVPHHHALLLPSSLRGRTLWLYWLVQLRWVALVAQAVVIAFSVSVLSRPELTVPAMVAVMWVLLLANHLALRTLDRDEEVAEVTLFNHLGLDMLALTALLALSGGADNPFAILYVVHLAMGALMLSMHGAGFLGGLALLCWSLLHLGGVPLALGGHAWASPEVLLTAGRWVALVVTGGSVLGFVVAAANSWRRREEQLAQARRSLGETMTIEEPWGWTEDDAVDEGGRGS
ncbi:MAG: hypothetical protein H6732_07630 [Alphaproteobacteria bacterium]|nr:hypothetical protein [Alphaproteobacteria bacterium]